MVVANMHHVRQHNHISASLSSPLVSGFRSLGEACYTMVASRRLALCNMHHDKEVTQSSPSFPLTLVSRFGESCRGISFSGGFATIALAQHAS